MKKEKVNSDTYLVSVHRTGTEALVPHLGPVLGFEHKLGFHLGFLRQKIKDQNQKLIYSKIRKSNLSNALIIVIYRKALELIFKYILVIYTN